MQDTIVIGGDLKLTEAVNGDLNLTNVVDGEGGTFLPLYPKAYSDTYEVTPSAETQTLYTGGLMMSRNVIINPIPSNYGLITWNGNKLTVS